MAWTYTYDIATPDGSADDPAEADDRMQEIKAAVQERENVDHYWPKTGTEVSDDDTGEHRKITLRTLSAAVVAVLTATKAYLYRLVTDGELYFKDASDNTIQFTSGGKIPSASLDMKDEDNMTSNSATHAATQQSIKAYADAIAAAATAAIAAAIAGDVPTPNDSESNAMVKAHAYLAQTSGYVTAWTEAQNSNWLRGYVGITNDPAGAGTNADSSAHATGYPSITFFVGKGKYFEVTHDSQTVTIIWTPLVSGGEAPVDQD